MWEKGWEGLWPQENMAPARTTSRQEGNQGRINPQLSSGLGPGPSTGWSQLEVSAPGSLSLAFYSKNGWRGGWRVEGAQLPPRSPGLICNRRPPAPPSCWPGKPSSLPSPELYPTKVRGLETIIGLCLLVSLKKKIYLFYFLAMLGVCCWVQASSSWGEAGLLSSCWALASQVWLLLMWIPNPEHGLSSCGLSCSAACGIFLDQGWNPYPLHWQADS